MRTLPAAARDAMEQPIHSPSLTAEAASVKPTEDPLLDLLTDCGSLLSGASNPVSVMVDIVRLVGTALDADRVLYFVRDPIAKLSHAAYGWARDGHDSIQPGPLRDEDFEEVITPLARGELSGSGIEHKSGANREVNELSGTHVDLLAPVLVNGELRGILATDYCREGALITARERNALRALATIAASALGRYGTRDTQQRDTTRSYLAREETIKSAINVAGELLAVGELDSALQHTLPLIGAMAACQRVAVLLRVNDDEGARRHRLKCEWVALRQPAQFAEGVTAFCDDELPPDAMAGLESGSPFWWRSTGRADDFSLRLRALGVAVSGALPLIVEGSYAGMLAFGWCFEPNLGIDSVEVGVLQLAANAVSAALQRQRAAERRIEQERAIELEQARHARRREDQLETANGVLRAINQRLAQGGDPTAALHAILEQAVLAFGASTDAMLQCVGENLRTVGNIGSPLAPVANARSETRNTHAERPSALRWRAVTEADVSDARSWRELGIGDVLEAEIFDGERVAGVLRLGFPSAPAEKEAIEWLVEQICQQTALAMRLASLSTELEARTRQETLLAERSRMAREIHDGVAQGFTGILMQLGALAETPEDSEHAKELANRAAALARQGLADARRAVLALQPESTTREDLVSALSHLVETSNVRGKIGCHFVVVGSGFDAYLGPARAHDLYRVVQEALQNALRHAQASLIEVSLTRTDRGLQLEVADNGIGFVEGSSDGFGIGNMRARVQDMGGSFLIDSKPGAGTRVILSMPA